MSERLLRSEIIELLMKYVIVYEIYLKKLIRMK